MEAATVFDFTGKGLNEMTLGGPVIMTGIHNSHACSYCSISAQKGFWNQVAPVRYGKTLAYKNRDPGLTPKVKTN